MRKTLFLGRMEQTQTPADARAAPTAAESVPMAESVGSSPKRVREDAKASRVSPGPASRVHWGPEPQRWTVIGGDMVKIDLRAIQHYKKKNLL
jgi:hypothetical protein